MAQKNSSFSKVSSKLAAELQLLNATLTGRLDAIDAKIEHQNALVEQRLKPLSDHEDRIRELEHAINALKVKYDLLTGGSLTASLVAFIKTILGV